MPSMRKTRRALTARGWCETDARAEARMPAEAFDTLEHLSGGQPQLLRAKLMRAPLVYGRQFQR